MPQVIGTNSFNREPELERANQDTELETKPKTKKVPAPANSSPEHTRRMNELAATVTDSFESRPQCVETLVLMNNEFLRFEIQFGLRPIFEI